MHTRILVPVDLNNTDKLTKALDLAADLARQNKAEVVYLDVIDSVPTPSTTTEAEKEAARLKAFAVAQADQHGIKTMAEVALRSDLHLNVGADIIKAANETNSDLIVMASHDPGLKDHIFSSNAGYVASHAPMSVYVVR